MQTPYSILKFQYLLRLPFLYHFNWGFPPHKWSPLEYVISVLLLLAPLFLYYFIKYYLFYSLKVSKFKLKLSNRDKVAAVKISKKVSIIILADINLELTRESFKIPLMLKP